MKIDVFVPEMIYRRSIRLKQTNRAERVERSKLIQTNLHEPDRIGSSHEKFDVWPRTKCDKFFLVQIFSWNIFVLRGWSTDQQRVWEDWQRHDTKCQVLVKSSRTNFGKCFSV